MKKIVVLVICCFLISGCSEKKQPVSQKPQGPSLSSETRFVTQIPQRSPEKSLYPVKQEKKQRIPAWADKIAATINQNYDSWREKSSTDTSSVLIASFVSSSVISTTQDSSNSSITPGSISLPSATVPSGTPSILRPSPSVSSGATGSGVSVASVSSSPSTAPSQPDSQNPPSPENPPQQPETPSQTAGVTVTRSIQISSGGAFVRLSVNVKDTRINGIIVSENIPEGYTLISSTPSISKRTGNSIKWLFYGTSLTDQTITYQLQGSGKAIISGSFSSTLGSGNTTGDYQIGQ
ncbi:MAG: hypothetical protein ACPL3Q_09360 [Candidatus Ratteibacteria bacterium]